MTQAEAFGGTMHMFQTAVNPEAEILKELRKFKFSILYTQITDDERFYENVSFNRGLRVRVFDDLEKAVGWLEEA